MIELSTHIEYLLLSRDEVSVPQLGTFIVKEMRSRRVDEEGIFLPPYRTLSFRWDEQEEGEDFIASFSKMHNLSRQDSRMMCMEYVDELMQALDEESSVSFGTMGYLVRDTETGEVCFMPLQSGIASPAYYGLDAVPFAKLSHEVRQHRDRKRAARKTRLTSIHADQDTITISINRRAFNYVTAVAASIVLFFTLTSPFGKSITSGISQKAEFFFAPKMLPEAKLMQPAEEQKEVHKTIEAQPVAEAMPEDQMGSQPELKEEAPKDDFVIVLASAISKKSAINYAGKLQEQGYKAMACEFGGMVRVIIPGFASQEDAYDEIRRMKADSKDFSNAWPCNVKEEVKSLE